MYRAAVTFAVVLATTVAGAFAVGRATRPQALQPNKAARSADQPGVKITRWAVTSPKLPDLAHEPSRAAATTSGVGQVGHATTSGGAATPSTAGGGSTPTPKASSGSGGGHSASPNQGITPGTGDTG